ncbi:MAG: hypothetical protein IJ112_07260 [Oscillospiraceae bacterium]|nr:hypothetical protein [Oscillospiraceae bacterium]
MLLKNDGTLPLSKQEPVAVFGRCQLDWFYVGYGSGGDVLMPGDFGHIVKKYKPDLSLLETLGTPDGITRAELERTALRVLQLVLKLRYRD